MNFKCISIKKIISIFIVLAISLSFVTGTVFASQTREQRLAQWYDSARTAIFLSWGMQTGGGSDYTNSTPEYTDVSIFEAAATAGGWSASKWVNYAKQMHSKYIVFCSFHNGLGYLQAWNKGNIPGSLHTSRDYLGELITAADAEGIKVVVYITGIPYNGGVTYGHQWLDKQAYRDYKGDQSLDIGTNDHWQNYFAKDVMKGLVDNYNVAGFWMDGWYINSSWSQSVYSYIHGLNDNIVFIQNNFGTGNFCADEDVIGIEDYRKVKSPSFDYMSGCWHTPGGGKEATFIAGGNWWYDGGTPVTNDKLKNGYIASTIASDIPSCVGFGPTIGGDFPGDLPDFTTQFDTFWGEVSESLDTTINGGGYGEGGLQPGNWGNAAYGVTTYNGSNGNHYLHVLRRPAGETMKWNGSAFAPDSDMGDAQRYGALAVQKDNSGDIWLVGPNLNIMKRSQGIWSNVTTSTPDNDNAQDLDIASDGTIFKVGQPTQTPNGFVQKWNGTAWTNIGGGGIHIAAVSSTEAWVCQPNGAIYKWNGSGWAGISGTAKDIAAGADGSVWCINNLGTLQKWNGSSWTGYTGQTCTRLDVDSSGVPYVVNTSGNIYKYVSGGFTQVTGSAVDIFCANDSTLWDKNKAGENIVTLPDGGYTITGATDLYTGTALAYTQSSGKINVTVTDWSNYETYGDAVIKLTSKKLPNNLIPKTFMSASANTQNSNYTASNLMDESYDTYYSSASGASMPVEINIDLGSIYNMTGIKLYQREDRPVSTGSYSAPANTRIKDYEIYVSSDGSNWGTAVKTGTLLNQRGGQQIDYGPSQYKYLKIRILSNYNNDGVVKIANVDIFGHATMGSSWTSISTSADQDISVAADGTAWKIGPVTYTPNGYLYKWNGSSWIKAYGGAVRIAAENSTYAWVVNSYGAVYKCTMSTAANYGAGGTAQDIGVGGDGSVWILGTGTDGALKKWNGSSWETKRTSAGKRLAVRYNGDVWVVTSSGDVYVYSSGGSWTQITGVKAIDVGVSSASNRDSFWATDTSGNVKKWCGGSTWLTASGQTGTSMCVDDRGFPWIVNSNGNIYRRD